MGKRVQIWVNNTRWQDTYPQSVMRGDIFRVFDENGNLFIFPDGDTRQVAGNDAYVERDGSVTITWLGSIKF